MEPKVYTYQKKYTTTGGEVRYYQTEKKYVPKDKTARPERKKKEGSVYAITTAVKEFDDIERGLVQAYIRELQEKRKFNERRDNRNGQTV